jgi:hypothetical protein
MVTLTAVACGLFPSLDGLSGSSDASSPIDTGDGADAGTGLLSCNAAGLVAYWSMNEGSGSVVHDCHQSLDGTFGDAGGVTWGTRDGGSDLEFTSSGFVSLGSPSQLQVAGPFTVAGWLRLDAVPNGFTSLFWNFSAPSGFEITAAPIGLYAQLGNGMVAFAANFPTPPLATWQHLCAVFEPGVRLEVYVNGVSVATTTTVDGGPLPNQGAAPDDVHEMRFGANYSFTTWSGGIDDVRVFSRALTPAEIKTLAAN